jgi:methylglyoxal synthase
MYIGGNEDVTDYNSMYKQVKMKKKLTIALVAHDRRKFDMVEWALHNAKFLSHHYLVCTGTTGHLIDEAFEKENIFAEISCMHSGPLGGDAEIAAMVVRKEIDLAIFLIDDLNAQPHEADIQMLLRQCRVHNVPIACNRYSADLMITSSLWDNDLYQPSEPKYIYFDRDKDFPKNEE